MNNARAGEAQLPFGYGVSATPFRDACRSRQALTRHRGEQYTADHARSTPTVQHRPHTGHSACSPDWIATTLSRVCSSTRQCRDLHLPEQNTAVAALVDGNGSPHSRQYRRPSPRDTTTLIVATIRPQHQPSKTGTQLVLFLPASNGVSY
ncbi:hypothetical protein [Streptomyces cellulosae]|uniref:hypothetical protein n=1 Tax=Streptomyces cellulosae TaxID=1968 RepID=UPI00131B59E2|nr:hypothetical protein [Streptomyces cellulosae]